MFGISLYVYEAKASQQNGVFSTIYDTSKSRIDEKVSAQKMLQNQHVRKPGGYAKRPSLLDLVDSHGIL